MTWTFLLAALGGLALRASPTPVPCCSSEPTPVEGAAIFELRDASKALTLDDVRAEANAERWRPNEHGVPSMGYTTAAHWFWFRIVNAAERPQPLILEYAWPVMRDIDVTVLRRTGAGSTFSGGSARPFDVRPIPYHHLAIPVELAPGERVDVYTRVESQVPLQLPVKLHRGLSLHLAGLGSEMVWGIYFGFMLFIALYNLVLFASLRERGHLLLALFVVSLAGLQASFSGHIHQYVFADWPAANLVSLPLFLSGTVLLGLVFSIHFLSLKEASPRLYKALWLVGAAAAVNLLVPLVSIGASAVIGNLLAIPACLGALGAGIFLGARGSSSARAYTAGWLLFLIGSTILALNKLGILPFDALTEYGWSAGAMVMAVLLSLGLASSIEKLKKQHEEVQRLVEERTAQLARQTQEAVRAREEATAAQAEAERYAEKIEIIDGQKTAFFRNISHELRTPLTLILNPLDEEAKGHPGNRNLELAAKNARRLLRLVNQLLDFQKLDAGKKVLRLVPTDLAAFLSVSGAYFRSACSSKQIDFRLTLDGGDLEERRAAAGPVFVAGDTDALEKVVFNFLSNALKHTPRGGRIELGLAVTAKTARIFVRDSGPGISREHQLGLFQIFSQVGGASSFEHEGTGLGLALVKELTLLMAGQVGVESAPGAGALFFAELPRCEPPAGGEAVQDALHIREWLLEGARDPAEPEPGGAQLIEEGPGKLVLVVDDLADMRLLISNTLKNRDYRVVTAPNGKEALQLARQHRPALIITDWMMPVMDGPALIRTLKADPALASIPVVLLTARSDEESKVLGTELGADAFVGKPFNELELMSSVRNLLLLKAREHEVEALNRQLVEDVLKRYLPPDLVDQILAGDKSFEQEPRSMSATILFSDLSGFTARSDTVRAAKMARILNEYLSRMTDVIFAHGGTIDKFIGDAIMVVFGAPVALDAKQQIERAIACADGMQAALGELNVVFGREGIDPFQMRIGIHHGPVIIGNFGSKRRSDYTAIGPTVNLASRIESVCVPGEIFISGTVYDYLAEDRARPAGEFELKGLPGAKTLYRLAAPRGLAGPGAP